ncbi:MAG: PIN domain-containing protein [candidate division WOR-3 bacterium]|nr:PIN domain-containing protein [candidate division WOR-3 bacterium]
MADETRLLIDSSVLLEFLLNQERADEVARFFERTPRAALYVTDFAFHSVALILVSRKRGEALARFVNDLLRVRGATLLKLTPDEVVSLATRTEELGLDFDDAYQYVVAEKHNLTLVSFDADFDRTERGRSTPADVLGEPPVARDKPPSKPARVRSRRR